MTTREAALEYCQRGWSVIPIRFEGSVEDRKRPLLESWDPYKTKAATEDQVKAWWTRWPSANVGIVMGEVSGLVALDLDGQHAMELIRQAKVFLPETATVQTSRGYHALFRHPGYPVSNRVKLLSGGDSGVDVRGDGGYVVAPPSIHGSGFQYRWVIPPERVVALPDGVAALMSRQTKSEDTHDTTWFDAAWRGVGKGQRNDMATRLAGYWLHITKGSEEAAYRAMTDWAARCTPPLPLHELKTTIKSVARREHAKQHHEQTKHFTRHAVVEGPEWADQMRDYRPQNGAMVNNIPGLSHVGGLAPGRLVFLAGRPGAGKSTLACQLTTEACLLAQEKSPTWVVSTEMTLHEWGTWMAAYLNSSGTHSLPHPLPETLLGWWRTSPIAITDSGTISIQDIRRIAESRIGLKLLIVDHATRIVGGRKESRNLEIGDVARGLKGIAKDLKCTVVSLVQMNRRVEGADNARPRLSDLRDCVTGDTLVWLTDGRRVSISSLEGTTPDVWALSPSGTMVASRATAVWKVGRRDVFRVTLASGRSMTVTARHRFLLWDGFTKASDLRNGDRVALTRHIPSPEQPITISDARIGLLAHLIGDGSYIPNQGIKYTTGSDANSAFVSVAAKTEFGSTVRCYAGRGAWHSLLFVGNGTRWQPAGLGAWLQSLGIYGQRSHTKRIPECIFQLDDRQAGLFLQHLWATDGCLKMAKTSSRGSRVVTFSTASRGLASDVAALLLRLSIVSRIRGPKSDGTYLVVVSGRESIIRFLDTVGCFGDKAQDGERMRGYLSAQGPSNTNVDTLPLEVWRDIRLHMKTSGVSHRAMAALRGTAYGGSSRFRFAPSRDTVRSYAGLLGMSQLIARCDEEIFWDSVVRVDSAGSADVYDLTVPGHSTWCSDGVITHNSGEIEQEADAVMFLWSKLKGEARHTAKVDMILTIEKNRHGWTGDIPIVFDRVGRSLYERVTR